MGHCAGIFEKLIITEHTMFRNKLLQRPYLINNRIYSAKSEINRRICKFRCVNQWLIVFDHSMYSFLTESQKFVSQLLSENKQTFSWRDSTWKKLNIYFVRGFSVKNIEKLCPLSFTTTQPSLWLKRQTAWQERGHVISWLLPFAGIANKLRLGNQPLFGDEPVISP